MNYPCSDSREFKMKSYRKHQLLDHTRRVRRHTAFTLVELLVVIAITSVLLILVVKPLTDSFNLVSEAGTQVESQAAARDTMREITADLGDAAWVYDNNTPTSSINLWVYSQTGTPGLQSLPNAMVDMVMPARQLDQTGGSTQTDPTTGLPIYPAGSNGIALPAAPGRVIMRYFIGLRDNRSGADTSGAKQDGMPVASDGTTFHGYANRWADPSTSNADNRTTLYKAEFPSSIYNSSTKSYIPNLDLFHTQNPAAPGSITDSEQGQLVLNDPNFFYDSTPAGPSDDPTFKQGDPHWGVAGWQRVAQANGMPLTTVYRWENWAAIASPVFPTNKADAVTMLRNDDGTLQYCNNLPVVRPLVTFTPKAVSTENLTPNNTSAAGDESPTTAAPIFVSKYGAWSSPFTVNVYRSIAGGDPLGQNPLTYYEYYIGADGLAHIVAQSVAPGAAAPNPSTLPDVGPQINSQGLFNLNQLPAVQMAFSVDPVSGTVNFAFPQWATLGVVSAPQQYDPNAINNGLTGAYGSRYLLLSQLAQSAYGTGTLNGTLPNAAIPALRLANATIVPGSERVYGPDQRPGPHYGYRIQYRRVAALTGVIGPNEYKINYTNLPGYQNGDPRLQVGYVQFDSQADSVNQPNLTSDPVNNVYPPNSLPSFKNAGGTNVVADPVEISYQFQDNLPGDVVQANYVTRDQMSVSIDAQLYDPSTAASQQTSLTQVVDVRNLQR